MSFLALFQSLTPLFEMMIIAIMLNYLLSFFWNTRSMDLVLGLGAFLLIFAASSWFNLPILHKIMYLVVNVAVIAVLIIFQPELRVALSKLSLKGKRYKEITEFDKFLDQLANSTYRLSEKRTGALIVLENQNSLSEYANKAVKLNASFSSELLETIFTAATPLHDGAVVVRDQTILAAAVILPLAEDSSQVTGSIGTRHRAALGISQITDALIIVISEETGKVSIARDGVMTRGVKIDRFKGIVRSIFTPPIKGTHKEGFNILNWLRG
ncbi:MAG: TIGR00159 family protein [Chlamydiales bacterium]|nr:TIGR00159 family protein [Chlamydiales bacterium]